MASGSDPFPTATPDRAGRGSPEHARGKVHRLWPKGPNEELVERLRSDAPGAARELYDRFASDVNRMIWRLVGADREHDDLVQQVFCAVIANVNDLREEAKLRGWVLTVTVNVVRSELRKRSVRRRFMMTSSSSDEPDRFHGISPDHEARDLLRHVYEVLAKLPADERIAFTLRYIDDRSLEETATLSDCSLATIKRRLVRAEKRFRSLSDRYPDLRERLSGSTRFGGGS